MIRTGIKLLAVAILAALPANAHAQVKKSDSVVKVAVDAGKVSDAKTSEKPKSLDGEWTWTQKSAAGGHEVERRVKLTLKNGKLEGTVFGGQFGEMKVPDAEIVSGEFKDGRITFLTGTERTTKYENVVVEDSIKGTSEGTGRDG